LLYFLQFIVSFYKRLLLQCCKFVFVAAKRAVVKIFLFQVMADQHQRLLANFLQKLEATRQLGLNDFSLKVDEEIQKGADGIFTADEVMLIAEEAKCAVEDVFQQVENMSGIFSKNLMDQALSNGITLSMNVDQIEAVQASPDMRDPGMGNAPLGGRLAPIGANDAIERENKSLKEENNRLNDLHLGMQQQLSDLLTQKSSMSSELELLKQQLKKLTMSGVHSQETQQEIMQLNHQIDRLQTQNEQRIAETTQFQNLKTILLQKNEKIREMQFQLKTFQANQGAGFQAIH